MLAILVVADVCAPGRADPLVADLDQRQVGHEAVAAGAMPMLLTWREEDAVAGADHLDWPAAPLYETDALGDVDRLAVGMGMPRRPCARREVDVVRLRECVMRMCNNGAGALQEQVREREAEPWNDITSV